MVGEFQRFTERIGAIYGSISVDLQDLKNKDPQDIDYSEYYDELKEFFQVLCSENRQLLKKKQIQDLFLIFSIEIFNNGRYHSSFWKTLYAELGVDKSLYNLAFSALLDSLNRFEIPVCKGSDNRDFVVFTLRRKSLRDAGYWELVCDFFLKYYKFNRMKSVKEYFREYSDDISYSLSSEAEGDIIDYVNRATISFSKLIEDHNENLDDENFIRSFLRAEGLPLGPFRHKRITSIIKDLSNRMTPVEFKKTLRKYINSDIINPEKQKMPVRQFLTTTIDFGDHFLDSCKYQITPNHRIGVKEMIQWELGKVGEYKGITYYKKLSRFEVRFQEVRRCISDNGIFFIWCGFLPIGAGIKIDNFFVRREGFNWDPKFKMTYGSEENPPEITIETGNVVFFGKGDAGKRLKIVIGSKIFEEIIGVDGYSSLSKIFHFEDNLTEFHVCALLDNQLIREKHLNLDEHILFSNNTRELLKGQRENSHIISKRFGESRYTLFSKYSPEIIDSHIRLKNCQKSEYNLVFNDYYIYEINWENEQEFELKIDNFIWKFQIKKEIHLTFKNSNNVFSEFEQFDLIVDITSPSKQDIMTYQVLNNTYQPISDPVLLEENRFVNGIYHLTGNELVENSLGFALYPGEYFIEIACGDLSVRQQFFIIPAIVSHWPSLLSENESIPIEFTSQEKIFLNSKSGEPTDTLSQNFVGKIEVDTNNDCPIILERKAINLRLISPRIAYSIDVPDIPIFGFRLYETIQQINGHSPQRIPRQELNYYDLPHSSLRLFSKLGDILTISHDSLKVGDFKILTRTDPIINSLSSFQQFCINTVNEFEILSSEGYRKYFKIYWNPKIICIVSNISCEKNLLLNLELQYDGPPNSKIKIIISSHLVKIKEIEIQSNGKQNTFEDHIELEKFSHESIFFVQTYLWSYKNEWVPSRQVIVSNEYCYHVTVKTGKTFELSKDIPYHLFTKEFFSERYAKKIISYPLPVIIELSTDLETTSVMKKILLYSIEEFGDLHTCILGDSELSRNLINSSSFIQGHERIHFLDSAEENIVKNIKKILIPYSLRQVVKTGLGVSTEGIWENINDLFPRIHQCMIFEAQKLDMSILDQIIKENSETKFVLVKRSLK
jgi:hypothetical protein